MLTNGAYPFFKRELLHQWVFRRTDVDKSMRVCVVLTVRCRRVIVKCRRCCFRCYRGNNQTVAAAVVAAAAAFDGCV